MSETEHEPDPESPTPARRVTVYVTLISTILLAVTLIVLTGYRWATQRTPSSILIIHATPEMADAQISVVGGSGQGARRASISPEHHFTTPMFLEAGTYVVKVEKQGKLIYRDDIYLAQGRRFDIDLTKFTPITP